MYQLSSRINVRGKYHRNYYILTLKLNNLFEHTKHRLYVKFDLYPLQTFLGSAKS